MAQVFVSIGSNIDPAKHICTALDALQQRFAKLQISKVYQSTAVGFEGEDFLNLAVGFDCDCDVTELSECLRDIETRCGRERSEAKFSARTLDLDILTYGNQVIKIGRLDLPRDEITRYAFVLLPLVDIAANEIHPLLQQPYWELWQNFDQPDQPLWPVDFIWQSSLISSAGKINQYQ